MKTNIENNRKARLSSNFNEHLERTKGGNSSKTLSSEKSLEKIESKTIHFPNGMNMPANYKNHLINTEGYTQKYGISGGHNRTNFLAEIMRLRSEGKNIKIKDIEQSQTKGISTISYKVPAYDGKGNMKGYKRQNFMKTVYDPKI